MRWIAALVIAGLVALSSGSAEAQAFKPRGAAKTPTKKAPAKKAPAKKAPAKKASAKKAPKKTRATPDPERSAGKAKSPEDEDDYVLIEDDDE